MGRTKGIGKNGQKVSGIVTHAARGVNLTRLQPGLTMVALGDSTEQRRLKAKNRVILHQISAMKLNQRMICSLLLFLAWAAPSPLFADPGAALFKEKHCALCHKIQNPGTVFSPVCPGLQGVRHRHSKDWVRKWLKDPAAIWAGNDADVQDINSRYFRYRGANPNRGKVSWPRSSVKSRAYGRKRSRH